MSYSITCFHCARKLRNAVFCAACNHSFCSWNCYLQHAAQHTEPLPPRTARDAQMTAARLDTIKYGTQKQIPK
jgi:hypothetical protein